MVEWMNKIGNLKAELNFQVDNTNSKSVVNCFGTLSRITKVLPYHLSFFI